MSNQIVISSGAKVRSLEGVLTGTAGIVSSVPYGGANGVATLDSIGKVPLSQLPSSVITYLGTWNASTNTPTLTNGVGDDGDLYICNVAGTVNFGAGPITFAVGDWVIYGSGTWQKSAGASGTVTSVALTESGDALTITGSPITTSGTINIGFAGTNLQYINGEGNLTTFPSLTGFVPYTGATSSVVLGLNNNLTAHSLFTSATAEGGLFLTQNSVISGSEDSTTYSSIKAYTNRYMYFSFGQPSALKRFRFDVNGLTDGTTLTYTMPNASGTLALTSNLSSYVPYTGATSNLDLGTFDLTTDIATLNQVKAVGSGGLSFNSNSGTQVALMGGGGGAGTTFYGGIIGTSASFATSGGSDTFAINHSSGSGIALNITKGGNGEGLYINKTSGSGNAATIIGTLNATTLVKNGGTSSQYLMADGSVSTGPDLTGYVTLATSQTISGAKTFSNNVRIDSGSTSAFLAFKQYSSGSTGTAGFTSIYAISTDTFGISYGAGNDILFKTASPTLPRTYTFPDASGTVALTSNLTGYVQGSGTTNYIPKFTASGTIGNSSIIDNGTITAYTNAFYVYQTAGTGAAFYMTGGGTDATISSVTSGGANQNLNLMGSTLSLWTGTLGGLAYTERMRITPTGNVGIGTTSPTSSTNYTSLVINGTTGSELYLRGSNTDYGYMYANSGGVALATQTSIPLVFQTNATERMRITSTGNVGIGTGSPQRTLSIANGGPSVEIDPNGGAAGPIYFNYNRSTSTYTTPEYWALEHKFMSNGGAERMRITSGGYLKASNNGTYFDATYNSHNFVSNNNGTEILRVYHTGTLENFGTRIKYVNSSPNGTSNWFLYCDDSTTLRAEIRSNGGLANYQANNVNLSDERTKKDIIPLESYWDKFKAIEIVKFKYNDQTHEDFNIGVIAQQVESVAPEFIDADGWGETPEDGVPLKSVYTADLHHATIKVLQEAMAKIEQLEAKVSALENKS
jgi:hypothetical protein